MDYKQINVRVPYDVSEQIRQLAFDKRISQTELINKYIKEGLKKETTQSKLD